MAEIQKFKVRIKNMGSAHELRMTSTEARKLLEEISQLEKQLSDCINAPATPPAPIERRLNNILDGGSF